jgi:hypothetical protein
MIIIMTPYFYPDHIKSFLVYTVGLDYLSHMLRGIKIEMIIAMPNS